MKRGRPNLRNLLVPLILEILNDKTARSINSIKSELSLRLNRNFSWNTVQKYLNELVEVGKVEAIVTPHSKEEGKEGIVVYKKKE